MAEYYQEEDHEKIEIQRHADRVDSEVSGGRDTGEGDLSSASDQLGVLLQMEIEVRWIECVGASAQSGAGNGEQQAQTHVPRGHKYAEMAMENHVPKDLIEKKL